MDQRQLPRHDGQQQLQEEEREVTGLFLNSVKRQAGRDEYLSQEQSTIIQRYDSYSCSPKCIKKKLIMHTMATVLSGFNLLGWVGMGRKLPPPPPPQIFPIAI